MDDANRFACAFSHTRHGRSTVRLLTLRHLSCRAAVAPSRGVSWPAKLWGRQKHRRVTGIPFTEDHMRAHVRSAVTTASLLFLISSALTTGSAGAAGAAGEPLNLVSPGDPYAACDLSGDGPGANSPSAEVEPYVAVSPRDPRRAIGIFQQDRWSNGGARGLTASYTSDGRHFSETPLPFSHCAPGGLPFQRASDGWVSFGPDGTAYASGLVFNATDARNGVAATTSYDGGRTWKHTSMLIDDNDPAIGDDKNSVTADPVHAGVAYQVWDRLDQT